MHPDLQARIRIVQSPANRWVKLLRAAVRRPPALGEPGALLALEGPLLLAEALRSGWQPAAVFCRRGGSFPSLAKLPGSCAILVLPPALFDEAVGTEAPQSVAALAPAPPSPEPTPPRDALLLVLARLQDPGNVGTLLRSAEAFGAHGVLLLGGTASPWNGKALRASAGSAFRLPLRAFSGPDAAAAWLRAHGVRSFAAVASGGLAPAQLALAQAKALWIGNEGGGLSAAEIKACDARVTLPMPGPVESLNAAIAGSLLLYEAAHGRAATP